MGNYRFRLSDMMPNAWFYKLKDMGKASRNQSISHPMKKSHPITASTTPKPFPPPSKQPYYPNRTSYYYPSTERPDKLSNSPIHPKAVETHFPIDPPRKSKRKTKRRQIRPSTKLVSSSVSAGCNCRVWKSESIPEYSVVSESPPYRNRDYDGDDDLHKPIITDQFEFDGVKAWSRSCSCRVTSSATDIIIDMGDKSSFPRKFEQFGDFNDVSELDLPPILTKPAKKQVEAAKLDDEILSLKQGSYKNTSPPKEHKSPKKKSPPGVYRLKLRANSPRLASKKIQSCRNRKSAGSKGLSESFAVVKSSSDPQRDFRDSMVEMIVENNIRASKDLEELLACYLSLNSNEYHDVIVKVFEQIWFDLTDIRL